MQDEFSISILKKRRRLKRRRLKRRRLKKTKI
jgi:hypothetical protein